MRSLFFVILILPFLSLSQRATTGFKSEFGLLVGGSNYIGDLNQFNPFYNTQLAAGLIYRYNVHSRMTLRANFTYGALKADDADAENEVHNNRNLSFESRIFELAGGLEFNYFPFQLGHDRYKGTGYLLAEIGIFHMNPMTEYNGDMIELQPLGTEGQGSSLSTKENYSLTQLCIPLGVGFRISIGKKACLNFEYGIRKTFTDYIDDVGSDTFVDEDQLAQENGPIAAELSNRNLNGSRYGKRGTSATSDWYSFCGVMFTFRLGKPGVCNNP